jgi:hypothetical protein
VQVRHVRLDHVIEDAGRHVQVDVEPGLLGDLADDVRVGRVLEGPRVRAGRKPVEGVVAANDRARPEPVVLGLDRGDLADHELVGRLHAGCADLDRHLDADVELRLAEDRPRRVPEGDDERVGHSGTVMDDHRFDLRVDFLRQLRAGHLDLALDRRRRALHGLVAAAATEEAADCVADCTDTHRDRLRPAGRLQPRSGSAGWCPGARGAGRRCHSCRPAPASSSGRRTH